MKDVSRLNTLLQQHMFPYMNILHRESHLVTIGRMQICGWSAKYCLLWTKHVLLVVMGQNIFLRKFSNLLSVKNLISHECRKKVINEIKTLEQRWDTYQRITVFESTHNWSSPGELWSAHSSSKKCPVSHGDGWCLTYRALQQRP